MSGNLTLALDQTERWKDQDGRLHVRVSRISKATVNPYRGSEIPGYLELGLDPDRIYQLLRPDDELEKAAPTFNNLPLLSKHTAVSADNPQEELVAGSTGTDARFEAPYLVNSLVVWRQEDIDLIESKDKAALSAGYYYKPVMISGIHEGLQFDGQMTEIRANHLALVTAGRAGPEIIVHDSKENLMPRVPLASRKALIAKGVLSAYLKPKLMAGTVLALDSALGSVNRLNWQTQKPNVMAAIGALVTPKLATDADLKDMAKVMDSIDDLDDGEAEDDELEGESDEDKAKREAEEKAKREKAAKDKAAKDKARDAAVSEEERKKLEEAAAREDEIEARRKEDERRKDDEKAARDQAMDAAIATAKKQITDSMKAAAEAREVVRPLVGAVSLAIDSADDIYRFALKSGGIDTKDVHPSALRAMVGMLPKPGASRPKIAQDGAQTSSLDAKFPALSRISQS